MPNSPLLHLEKGLYQNKSQKLHKYKFMYKYQKIMPLKKKHPNQEKYTSSFYDVKTHTLTRTSNIHAGKILS